jgi:hypothetical protein
MNHLRDIRRWVALLSGAAFAGAALAASFDALGVDLEGAPPSGQARVHVYLGNLPAERGTGFGLVYVTVNGERRGRIGMNAPYLPIDLAPGAYLLGIDHGRRSMARVRVDAVADASVFVRYRRMFDAQPGIFDVTTAEKETLEVVTRETAAADLEPIEAAAAERKRRQQRSR